MEWSMEIYLKTPEGNKIVFDSKPYGSLEFSFMPTPNLCQLYDLTTDPKETRNLFHDPANEATKRDLYTRLGRFRILMPPPTFEELSPKDKEALRALGYL